MSQEEPAVGEPAPRRKPRSAAKSVILSRVELLAIFDSNPDRAEQKYRELCQKLVRYFGWNRKSDPEDLAQETLKRGLSRLQQGQQITVENPERYFFGVARNLVRESWNARKEEQFLGQELELTLPLFHNLNRGEQLVFLKECLRDLPTDDLEMLMAYLDGDGDTWAREAGLQPTTVRSRIHRTRKRLERLTVSIRSWNQTGLGPKK